MQVLRRELCYLSSLPADFIHDFHQWLNRPTAGIIKNFESFEKRDSNLKFEGVEALGIKFNLLIICLVGLSLNFPIALKGRKQS